jgi:hypothetical protein
MAVSTPVGFTTVVTVIISDNFCALANSCRSAQRTGIEYGLRSNFYVIRFILYIELKRYVNI